MNQFLWMGLYARVFLVSFAFLLLASPSNAQSFVEFDGDYNYLLNRLPADAFVLTQDKRIGIVFTSVFEPLRGGQITTFDVNSGLKIDSQFTGFGPLQVQVVKLSDKTKVVALTSRGGPNTVSIFDMDESGHLTFVAETRLTSSSSDDRSNPVLSSRARAGFVRVTNQQFASELVSFSLDDGSILQRASVPVSDILTFHENAEICMIASGRGRNLNFIDVTIPTQMALVGQATLPSTELTASSDLFSEFSADGNVVFAGGNQANLSAVSTNSFQVLSSINESYSTANLATIETSSARYLSVLGGDDNFRGISLIDITNPSALAINSKINLRQDLNTEQSRDLEFSADGSKLFLITNNGLWAFRTPQLIPLLKTKLWQQTLLGFTVKTTGKPERIIGAWGSDNNFSARIYYIPIKSNNIVNFDLDGSTDIGVITPSNGWKWLRTLDGASTNPINFGKAGDIPVPADFDGDAITDLAVYRPSTGEWQITESNSSKPRTVSLGGAFDRPVPSDFDGDGKADIGIFRPVLRRWMIIQSSDGHLLTYKAPCGKCRPVIGDYDGDGKADFAVFWNGFWSIGFSSGGSTSLSFGQAGDVPISGDFDNDGKTDIGTFTPSTATWRIQRSLLGLMQQQLGQASDLPVPADYDGDGRTDVAVYRPANSTWFINQSSAFGTTVQFGTPGDRPLTWQY